MDYHSNVGRTSMNPLALSDAKFIRSNGDISLTSESSDNKVRQTAPLVSEYQLIEDNHNSLDLEKERSELLNIRTQTMK